jgi:hypothetical protein
MDLAQILAVVEAAISILKEALNGAQGLLALVIPLILTGKKLIDLCVSKKSPLADFPPGRVSYT